MPASKFTPEQAEEVAAAFGRNGVRYLFLGKSGAILLGYPAVTQDVDLFLPKDRENGGRALKALAKLGFRLDEQTQAAVVECRDFVQIKDGPFDLDLIHAPDGIESFEEAMKRSVVEGKFAVANLRDIIASKRASGREKDLVDLPLLEDFRLAWEAAQRRPLKTRDEVVE